MRRLLRRSLPGRETLRRHRLLTPIAQWMDKYGVWSFGAQAVARGIALGFFFGFFVPIGQIPLAVVAALLLRANPLVAAFATFISNPLTFPVIYLLAFKVGAVLLGEPIVAAVPVIVDATVVTLAEPSLLGMSKVWAWMTGVGKPLVVGLVFFAVGSAIVGYALTLIIWRLQSYARLKRRRLSRKKMC